MANVKKIPQNAVERLLKHNNRELKNDSNKDIDSKRTQFNKVLTPKRESSDYEYYKKRLNEVYVYNRPDVKTLASFVVTLPKEITDPLEQERFFQCTYDFLEKRYGENNVIQAVIHRDEGKTEKVRNRFTGKIEKDENGQPITKIVGQPHLHFCWIPTVKIDHEKLHKKKKYPKAMDNYTEKVSSNEVLTKKELQHFHTDFQNYIDSCYLNCLVNNGSTKLQGRNYSVEELKEKFETKKELERLYQIEKNYVLEYESIEPDKKGRW
jgi:hypothetical protein